MKTVLVSILLGLAVLMNVSCKKETDSQMQVKELQSLMQAQSVGRIMTTTQQYLNPANVDIFGDWGTHYSFHAPFVTVESSVYNLTALKKYEVLTISTYKVLVLYF